MQWSSYGIRNGQTTSCSRKGNKTAGINGSSDPCLSCSGEVCSQYNQTFWKRDEVKSGETIRVVSAYPPPLQVH